MKLFSVIEAAEVLGCGKGVVYRLIRERELAAKRLGYGGKIVIREDALSEFVENLPDYEAWPRYVP